MFKNMKQVINNILTKINKYKKNNQKKHYDDEPQQIDLTKHQPIEYVCLKLSEYTKIPIYGLTEEVPSSISTDISGENYFNSVISPLLKKNKNISIDIDNCNKTISDDFIMEALVQIKFNPEINNFEKQIKILSKDNVLVNHVYEYINNITEYDFFNPNRRIDKIFNSMSQTVCGITNPDINIRRLKTRTEEISVVDLCSPEKQKIVVVPYRKYKTTNNNIFFDILVKYKPIVQIDGLKTKWYSGFHFDVLKSKLESSLQAQELISDLVLQSTGYITNFSDGVKKNNPEYKLENLINGNYFFNIHPMIYNNIHIFLVDLGQSYIVDENIIVTDSSGKQILSSETLNKYMCVKNNLKLDYTCRWVTTMEKNFLSYCADATLMAAIGLLYLKK